jgi:hypothetical protein
MAVSTANTILSYSSDGTTFNKLVDITNYPDLGATPSKLDTTDLTAKKFKTSILGLQEIPDLTFEANYDKDAYALIDSLTDTYTFKLEFGENGEDGTFTWDGQVSVYAVGGGVDEVRKMTVTCSAETEIVAS